MSDPHQASYEQVPYESPAHYVSHPERIAVAALLLGLSPPPIDRCSVLELGCATGGNLIPMALGLPNSRFVGVDFSPRQIEIAVADARSAGAANVEFLSRDITQLGEDVGQFDFIIAHGVYSWVPFPVRDALLRVCRQHLAPAGLAYVSYNIYPGWHGRRMIREMVQYRTRTTGDPLSRVSQARAFIEALAPAAQQLDPAVGQVLHGELSLMAQQQPFYLAHEYFEEFNEPVYFHQFVGHAAHHGLEYVAESPLNEGIHGPSAGSVSAFLRSMPHHALDQEQYFDFACDRTFRRSVLRRPGAAIAPLSDAPIRQMHIEGLAFPASAALRLGEAVEETFRLPGGLSANLRDPLMKSALAALAAHAPGSLPFPRLQEGVAQRMGTAAADAARLSAALLQAYLQGFVDLHLLPPAFTTYPSDRPRAFASARVAATRGADRTGNLRHRVILLSEFDRLLLPLLDGHRTLGKLAASLAASAAAGQFTILDAGKPMTDPRRIQSAIGKFLPDALRRLASNALLVG